MPGHLIPRPHAGSSISKTKYRKEGSRPDAVSFAEQGAHRASGIQIRSPLISNDRSAREEQPRERRRDYPPPRSSGYGRDRPPSEDRREWQEQSPRAFEGRQEKQEGLFNSPRPSEDRPPPRASVTGFTTMHGLMDEGLEKNFVVRESHHDGNGFAALQMRHMRSASRGSSAQWLAALDMC